VNRSVTPSGVEHWLSAGKLGPSVTGEPISDAFGR